MLGRIAPRRRQPPGFWESYLGVRFFIGRAGTGKTTACWREMEAQQHERGIGAPLVMIVPEQFTFTAERMMLGAFAEKGGGGSFRARVLSFARLALLLVRERGVQAAGQPMSELVRLVLLEETIREAAGELGIFGGAAKHAGFVKEMDRTLRELRRHGHTAESLRKIAGHVGEGELDAVARRKMTDLARLLEVWSPVVDADRAMDPERLLDRAREIVGETDVLANARIWIDGFSVLTPLEMRLTAALARQCAEVTISLCADPDGEGFRQMREVGGIFSRTERLQRQLVEMFRREGTVVTEMKMFRARQRFQKRALAVIEAELFAEGSAKQEVDADGVEIWECSDPETEVRCAAQAIRAAVMDEGLRYREVGVIVPALDGAGASGYEDAIRRIFREHGIPHFIDRRRSITHHPLVELLRSATAIVTRRWDADDVVLYLKTNLAGVSETEAAATENYILAHGISHVPWEKHWEWAGANQREEERNVRPAEMERLRLVNVVRQRVWNDLRAWIELAWDERAEREVAAYVAGLKQLMGRLRVQERMERLITEAEENGDAELAQIHRQAWRQVGELLEMLAERMKGRVRTTAGFEALLGSALETLTLGLIPPTVDQVGVSSVARSRVPELKRVFILGATEGVFPQSGREDPILSDEEREAINRVEEDAVGAGGERRAMEMEFFDYVAFTRAREALVVSYPVANRQGKAVTASRYVGRLREIFGQGLVEKRFDAGARWNVERIATADDVLAATATWARRRMQLPEEKTDGRMAAIYDWTIGSGDARIAAGRELLRAGLMGMSEPKLSVDLAARFYAPGEPLRMSVTQLEKFAACPLQYFLHFTLGLEKREVLELDVMNLGTLYHAILEAVFLRVIDGKLKWPGCGADDLRKAVEEEVENCCKKLHGEISLRTPAYGKIKERTKRNLFLIVEGQRRRAEHGTLRPSEVELNFGGRKRGGKGDEAPRFELPVLRVEFGENGGERELHLNGKIDRVDTGEGHAVVYDYKSSSKKLLQMWEVYWGLSLQLPVYALVMGELGKRQPVAGLYVALGMKRETVKRPVEAAGPEADEFFHVNKPRGVIDAAGAETLDDEVGGKKSAWFSMAFNKNGAPDARSDVLEHEDFAVMLRYARWKAAAMAGQLVRGEIAPMPYRKGTDTPCERCDFSSLCMFDRAMGNYRRVGAFGKADAMTKMREAMEEQ